MNVKLGTRSGINANPERAILTSDVLNIQFIALCSRDAGERQLSQHCRLNSLYWRIPERVLRLRVFEG